MFDWNHLASILSAWRSENTRFVYFPGTILAIVFVIAGVIWDQTFSFSFTERPTLLVLALYLLAFAVFIVALRGIVATAQQRVSIKSILIFGIVFRAIQLFASPYLEIDIYRYMWDGIVMSEGISPYRWSPAEALAAPDGSAARQKIVDLANSSESVQEIVRTVHFPEYTTIYPPVSQAVFCLTMWCVPNDSSVYVHLTAMKSVLILFDIGTMLLVLYCLKITQQHTGWILAYAWNPLLIKEIANSGHLDSIAVFFMIAAATLAINEFQKSTSFRKKIALQTAGLISMAVGAKLFPVVLVPLLAVWIWSRTRLSAGLFIVATAGGCLLIMAPLLIRSGSDNDQHRNGLGGFLSSWRMNALPFDIVYENVRPRHQQLDPWYSLVPQTTREKLHVLAERLPGDATQTTKITRVLTLAMLACFYLTLLLLRWRRPLEAHWFPVDAFVALTSFLFLQPTVNPWYWTWVIPFCCFVRKLGWHLAGGCLMLYYSRFWFKFSGMKIYFDGINYGPVDCFDHWFVWIEYLSLIGCVFCLPRIVSEPELDTDPA